MSDGVRDGMSDDVSDALSDDLSGSVPEAGTGYVDVHGHRTWLHRSGTGEETVLLLHGGMSSSDEILGPLEPELATSYRVAAFDRRGHGRTADTDEPFHYAAMAEEVIGVIELLGGPVHLVGWSDGGIAALLASLRRPDLVLRQVLIGANFDPEGIADLGGLEEDSEVIAMMAAEYATRSPDGADHFPVVHAKGLTLARTEPRLTSADLAGVAPPTLVMAGDDDLVTLPHTVALYEALPAGQLAVVPGTSHIVPLEKPALVGRLIRDFLTGAVPPQTFLPVRRRGTVA